MPQNRKNSEYFFKASDGKDIFYRYWPSIGKEENKCFVLLHRGHEHSARLQHIVDELNLPQVPMFSFDARGHGKTEGPRGFSPSVARSVEDIEDFINHICKEHQIQKQNILIIAQSISSVYASAWVHDYAPKIRGLVLASPAFSIKLYVPFACPAMALWQKIIGRHFYISSYVNANFLTHDPQRRKSYNQDPLITRAIASHMLLELKELGDRIVKDARAITLPVQMFISGSDVVVHHKPHHKFYQNLGSAHKEKHIMQGFYHDTLGESNRALIFDKIRDFIDRIYSVAEPANFDYKNADVWGPCADQYRKLQNPRPFFCLKGWGYKISKFAFNTLGQLSDGLRLGKKTGFNSGAMLDYVYQNKPSGKLLIGKLFDKFYLNTPGWAGIRQRKINLEKMIIKAADLLKRNKQPLNILDVAAGHGRYLLDTLKKLDGFDSALLRDFDAENVKQGQKLIKEYKLENKVKFEKADAFDIEKTSSVNPKPTLAVVSGFYEIFPENKPVEKSLKGIAKALEKGGFIIYTAQPYHPQLELIARTLRDLHAPDKMWIMRARTQAEMDFLVKSEGFVKQAQIIDENGIFSVSIAQKQ